MKTIPGDWCKAITYGAGMQGACSQEVANKVLEQTKRIYMCSNNSVEWSLAMSMKVYNKLKRSQFSEGLITYLLS